MKKIFQFLFMFCIAFIRVHAQDDRALVDKMIKDDSADVNTIASYSEDMRNHIFDASGHAEGIAKLSDAQKKSNESFKNLLSPYSKEEQNKIWNLTRYDELVDQLVNGGKKTDEELKGIVAKFPEEVREDAIYYGSKHFDLLSSIQNINKEFDQTYQNITSGYSSPAQTSFRELLKAPETFSLLNSNMRMTVLLGDIYKRNPDLLKQRFNDLNLELARQKTRDLEDWKENMKNNPDAENELEQSAKDYAKENGYNENDYANANPQVIEHYVYVPYPYWCGYPWWYESNYWYPYPYWFHWGFYFRNGSIVWYGQPSWYFVHWHFHHHHIHDYPHITNVYLNYYYYGPRRTSAGNSREVGEWMNKNENQLLGDFRSNTAERVERLREFEDSEIKREQFNKSNPAKPMNRDNYMKQHRQEYPALHRDEGGNKNDRPAQLPVKEKRKIYLEKSKKVNPPPRQKEQKQSVTPAPKKKQQPVIAPANPERKK